MNQRILILGTDNFLGRRIQMALAQTDWAQPFDAGHSTLADAISACDCVVSCTMGAPDGILRSAQSLFSSLKAAQTTPRIVLVSSMTVYGGATGVVDESTPLCDDQGAYAAARAAAERLAANHPNVITLRLGCEYGPTCIPWSVRVGQWLMARRIGDIGAAGDGYCNLAYIDDIVDAVSSALRVDDAAGQAFNIANPTQLTWNDYFVLFGKALGAVPVRRISQRRLTIESKLLAPPLKLGELALKATALQSLQLPPAITKSALNSFKQDICLETSRAERILGLQWTPVEEGLRRTAAWFHDQNRSHRMPRPSRGDLHEIKKHA